MENVYTKLARVQAGMSVPKERVNSFGNFSFRSCEDILAGAKKLVSEVGAIILLHDSIEHIEGVRYVVAIASFIDIENGTKIDVKGYAEVDKGKPKMSAEQVIGCASSYARKYALCGLLAVDNGLEVDSMEQKEKSGAAAGSVKNTTAEYITSEQVQELKQYTKELACDVPKFLKIFNASDFKFILACDYQQAVNMLKRKKEKMSKDNKTESV
mgnify:CR=1 FL=1